MNRKHGKVFEIGASGYTGCLPEDTEDRKRAKRALYAARTPREAAEIAKREVRPEEECQAFCR